MLDDQQRAAWEREGSFVVPGFADAATVAAMTAAGTAIARAGVDTLLHEGKIVMAEQNLRDVVDGEAPGEQRTSKVFRLHRDPPFDAFIASRAIRSIGASLLGDDLDCFLSQLIFKNPGAWGQPWHQDEFYFPFDRSPQVGLWLALTDATPANGCLSVVPGSHRGEVHEHVADRRPGANLGYVEIIDQDTSGAVPVTMRAGDLLVFHSRLMHRSTDNESDSARIAMVYHLAAHGTVDLGDAASPVNDWVALPPLEEAR